MLIGNEPQTLVMLALWAGEPEKEISQKCTSYNSIMNWQDRISLDPKILSGKPVIKGTRLAVEFVIDLLANDWTESEIIQNYPRLTHEDIQAISRL